MKKYCLLFILVGFLASCGQGPEDTGVEYAPAMYHTIPYEPYTQVADKDNEYDNTIPEGINNKGSNLLHPVKGTVPRSVPFNSSIHNEGVAQDLMRYDLDPLDASWAEQNLICPLPASEEVIAEGKELYNSFCQHCHGKQGKGDGKVAEQYPGVPNQYRSTLTEGKIFHVITYGQNAMWPHGSQIPVENRWKIVRFVQTLQQ